MATLKGGGNAAAAIAHAESSRRPRERKTRISFELDPLLLMTDDAMEGSFEDCALEWEGGDRRGDYEGMDLLAELLRV